MTTEPRQAEPARPPRVSRRQVLAISGLVAAAGAGGVALRVVSWWDVPADAPYACLSEREARLADSLAEALFPAGGRPALSGADAGLARFLDDVLDATPAPTAELLRLFLHALDDFTRLSHFAGYVELPLAERSALLEGWSQSDNYLFRSAVSDARSDCRLSRNRAPSCAPSQHPSKKSAGLRPPGPQQGPLAPPEKVPKRSLKGYKHHHLRIW